MVLSAISIGMMFAALALWPRLKRERTDSLQPPEDRKVSAIIPARNEAHNLPILLASLQQADCGPSEVIVMDDGSTDETAAVAREYGAKVFSPGPPPDGWHGKTWACHQGAKSASGEVFCFLDADTFLAGPSSWRDLQKASVNRVFSVCPWHRVKRPYESLSLFFNLNMVLGTVPDGLFGQVLWISRDAYALCGGHESVADRVLENHALAKQCESSGLQVRSAIGQGLIHFRMYPSGITSLIEGWRKGFSAGAGVTPGGVMFWIVVWLSALMMAWIALVLQWNSPFAWCGYVTAAVSVWMLSRRVGGFPWWVALAYPVPLLFFFGLFGWAKLSSGRKVTWKGREILAD